MRLKTILVVDDEASIRILFKNMFEEAGFSVLTAGDARAALSLLTTEKIKLFFLDLNLPGMNGMELCRMIRSRTDNAVICAITGYAADFDKEKCRQAGFDYYFRKPLRLEKLIKLTNDVFAQMHSQN